MLDAFGREQVPDESHDVEAAPSHSTVSQGELLSRIRKMLDEVAVVAERSYMVSQKEASIVDDYLTTLAAVAENACV